VTRVPVVAALVAMVAVGAGATAAGAAGDNADTAEVPSKLTTRTETFVDTTRSSPASETLPEEPTRTLVTTIRYPTPAKQALPLLVIAHGWDGNSNKFDELATAWASAGYVVAAPLFPRSSDVGGGLIPDVANQPGDISFVLDELLRLNASRRSPLHGRIDAERIGLGGLSLGGWTTYGVVWNSCCADERVDAGVLMSAIRGGFEGGTYTFRSVPALLLHGDADGYYPQSPPAYADLVAPKWFVTLHGAGHASPFEDTPDPYTGVVHATTIAFWNLTLKDEKVAATQLVDAVDASGQATLQSEPGTEAR
jgi:dienelactone hydrolase